MLERKLIEQFPPTLFECNPLSEVLLAPTDSIFWNILDPLVTMHTYKNNKVMFKNVKTTQRIFNVLYSYSLIALFLRRQPLVYKIIILY